MVAGARRGLPMGADAPPIEAMNREEQIMRLGILFTLILVWGCSGEVITEYPSYDHVPVEDLQLAEEGKADGSVFDSENLMDDGLFVDVNFLSADDLDEFLYSTPYGKRSFLADYEEEGIRFSDMIMNASREYRINPLVLVVKVQVESSLIARDTVGSQFTIDRAMGCGCPDDARCDRRKLGLNSQIRCAASVFRSYLDDMDDNGRTISGWGVGIRRRTSEGTQIVPRNKATAALYTYTPWVLRGTGGNWLFWNVFRKYTRSLLKNRPNYRWVGGECSDKGHCGPSLNGCSNEILPLDLSETFCTVSCERICPDANVPYSSITFCADIGAAYGQESEGWCVPRCDIGLFPDNDGCRSGFRCQSATRFGEDDVRASVCLPETVSQVMHGPDSVYPTD